MGGWKVYNAMSKSPLTDSESLEFIREEKQFKNRSFQFPHQGDFKTLEAEGIAHHTEYLMDINRKRCTLSRITYQNRVQKVVTLLRLDVDTKPHKNPDGKIIGGTHLHIYKEGYLTAWAYELEDPILRTINPNFEPADLLCTDMERRFEAFSRLCNFVQYPVVNCSLFD